MTIRTHLMNWLYSYRCPDATGILQPGGRWHYSIIMNIADGVTSLLLCNRLASIRFEGLKSGGSIMRATFASSPNMRAEEATWEASQQ